MAMWGGRNTMTAKQVDAVLGSQAKVPTINVNGMGSFGTIRGNGGEVKDNLPIMTPVAPETITKPTRPEPVPTLPIRIPKEELSANKSTPPKPAEEKGEKSVDEAKALSQRQKKRISRMKRAAAAAEAAFETIMKEDVEEANRPSEDTIVKKPMEEITEKIEQLAASKAHQALLGAYVEQQKKQQEKAKELISVKGKKAQADIPRHDDSSSSSEDEETLRGHASKADVKKSTPPTPQKPAVQMAPSISWADEVREFVAELGFDDDFSLAV
jgi:hypothetical protein